MLEALIGSFAQLMQPSYMGLLLLGMFMGLMVGAIPGVGGTTALVILMPFLFYFDVNSAIPLLVGIMAVVNTGDAISSILISVPGTSGAAATILDGYPMARKGEAGRALTVAFVGSAIGGVLGAVFLALSIPIARPLLNQFGSPEFFMLTMLGVSMAGVLSGRSPLRGLIAAGFGLLLSAIGTAPLTSYVRYTFGVLYLYDGIPLIVLTLGMFAIPEIFDLTSRDISIAGGIPLGKRGVLTGIKDIIREKWLVLRSTIIGVYIGFIPGLGASVASWLAYGHAVQSSKDKNGFGNGDVRGIIGPETANNAARGGELIPTILFGIPGGPIMAVFMVALMVLGIHAGPEMVTNNLPIVFSIMWSLAIANVVGALACILLTKQLARITSLPIHILAPFVLIIVMIGAYQSTQNWGDLVLLLFFGLLGWLMKRFEFSRPALLIGFVLGGIAEGYLGLSVQRYGAAWLLHPWVIAIGIFTVASLIPAIKWQTKRARKGTAEGE